MVSFIIVGFVLFTALASKHSFCYRLLPRGGPGREDEAAVQCFKSNLLEHYKVFILTNPHSLSKNKQKLIIIAKI